MAGTFVAQCLGGSTDIASYNVTFFGLGNAWTFPLAHALGKHFGIRQTLLVSLILFFITIFGCIYARTYFLFVLARFSMGVATGVFFPLGMEWINRLWNNRQELAFSTLAVITTITPVLGASLGGWLAYDYHWSLIFSFQIPGILFCFYMLYKTAEPLSITYTKESSFDYLGYILYLLGTSGLIIFITLGQELDWFRSPFLQKIFVIGLISLGLFCRREWKQKYPFMDLKLFSSSFFSIASLFLTTLYSAYFGMVILLTLWLHLTANYTPIWIAVLLSHMLIAAFFLYVFLNKGMHRMSPWCSVFLSAGAFTLSCFYSTTFNVEVDFFRLALARIMAGFGLAFFLFPLFSLCLHELPKEKHPSGIALFQTLRLLAGTVGIAAYTTIWYRRCVFYHDRLDSTLPTAKLYALSLQKKALLEQALSKQSTALALADVFDLMAWILLCTKILGGLFLLCTQIRHVQHSQGDSP